MDELEQLAGNILALDADYWKCEKCGVINTLQVDGDTCWLCRA